MHAHMYTLAACVARLLQKTSRAWPPCTYPDNVAGRKHQIRIHCAQQLGAPVVGDSRHGLTRGPAQDALAAGVAPAVRRLLKGRLMLHARSIRISRPLRPTAHRSRKSETSARTRNNASGSIEVEAPVPEHFAALLHVLGFQVNTDAA